MLALSLPKVPSLLSDAQLSIPKTLATNSRLVHATHLVVPKKAAQLSLGIPAPTRPPGGGGVPVSWSDRACKSFPCVSYAKPGEGVWMRRISFSRGWARPALLGCVVAAPAADGRFSQVRSHRR